MSDGAKIHVQATGVGAGDLILQEIQKALGLNSEMGELDRELRQLILKAAQERGPQSNDSGCSQDSESWERLKNATLAAHLPAIKVTIATRFSSDGTIVTLPVIYNVAGIEGEFFTLGGNRQGLLAAVNTQADVLGCTTPWLHRTLPVWFCNIVATLDLDFAKRAAVVKHMQGWTSLTLDAKPKAVGWTNLTQDAKPKARVQVRYVFDETQVPTAELLKGSVLPDEVYPSS